MSSSEKPVGIGAWPTQWAPLMPSLQHCGAGALSADAPNGSFVIASILACSSTVQKQWLAFLKKTCKPLQSGPIRLPSNVTLPMCGRQSQEVALPRPGCAFALSGARTCLSLHAPSLSLSGALRMVDSIDRTRMGYITATRETDRAPRSTLYH